MLLKRDKTDGNITHKTPIDHISRKQDYHNAILDKLSETIQTCQKKAVSPPNNQIIV